jgi:hypothetical protein
MIKIALVWPPQRIVVESLFRHYNGLAEVAGYLENSMLIKKNDIEIDIHDCAVKVYSMRDIADFIYRNDMIFICINMNNIIDALEFVRLVRSFDKKKIVVVYGEGVCCNVEYFSQKTSLNYVIGTGKYDIGIEALIAIHYHLPLSDLDNVLQKNGAYVLDNKVLDISKDTELPSDRWGIPFLEKLPIEDYKRIGNNELHITTCKGCPYTCKFCNERYVSSMKLQYRPAEHIVQYMKMYHDEFKTIYLDSSTFTFNRDWVFELCRKLKELDKNELIPWKTCTRLDCLDEMIIKEMAEAGCVRISIGVETLNNDIQNNNKKVINMKKLYEFRDWCSKYGILPRLLLIIGLEDESIESIKYTINVLEENGFDLRFRIFQNFQFLLDLKPEEINEEMLKTIDRINVPPFIDDAYINYCRCLEYPQNRK